MAFDGSYSMTDFSTMTDDELADAGEAFFAPWFAEAEARCADHGTTYASNKLASAHTALSQAHLNLAANAVLQSGGDPKP